MFPEEKCVPHADGVLGNCIAYKMIQMPGSCNAFWYMRILVQNTAKPELQHKLAFYHQHEQKLLEKLHVMVDLNLATEKHVLMDTKMLKLHLIL